MPILDLQRRLHEAGRIRIGQQVATSNGKTRPAKLERFRLTSSDRQAMDAAAELYGGEVHAWEGAPVAGQWELFTDADDIPVVIPPAATAFSQYYESWSGGGCTRRCDGEQELISGGPCVCDGEDERTCKPTTRLNVIMHDLPGLGVWRLESHGYYAATELAGIAEIIMHAATRGTLLPARLRLEQRQVKRPGEQVRKFAVPVLDVTLTPASIGLVTGAAPSAVLTAPVHELPAGGHWTPLAAVPELEQGEMSAALTDPRRPDPKRRSNSAPELPATGVQPRTGFVADDGEPVIDPADTSPPELLAPTDAQRRKAMASFQALGITDRAERLNITGAIVGHDVASFSALTRTEAGAVIDALEQQLAERNPTT